MRRRSRGFTLMEILLVTVMLSVLSVAIFKAFSNGIKLWAKGNHLVTEADIALFFDKLGEDLRSVPRISGIPFKGIGSQVSFPTIVLTRADERSARAEEGMVDQIGAVKYEYDFATRTISRRIANYSEALKEKWQLPTVAAVDIEAVNFRYYFRKLDQTQVKTQTDEGIPVGVMVEIMFTEEGKGRGMRRYFPIIAGGVS